MWERNIDWLPLAHASTRDQTHNPGMCCDWELNQQLFALRIDIQPSHTTQGYYSSGGWSSETWYQHGWVSALFCSHTSCILTCGRGQGALWDLSQRALILFMRANNTPNSSPSKTITLGIRTAACGYLGGHFQTVADHHMEQHGHQKSANLLKCHQVILSLSTHCSCLCQGKSDLLLHEFSDG